MNILSSYTLQPHSTTSGVPLHCFAGIMKDAFLSNASDNLSARLSHPYLDLFSLLTKVIRMNILV